MVNRSKPVLSARRITAGLLLATVAFGTGPAAAGASAWAGPSVVKVAETGLFSGRAFAPNSAVTVAVRGPDGSESHHSAVTSADGTLQYSFKPGAAGMYSLRVLNAAGRQISAATFNSVP